MGEQIKIDLFCGGRTNEQWRDYIKESEREGINNILEWCKRIYEAKQAYGKSFAKWAKEWYQEYSISTLKKLSLIGEQNKRLVIIDNQKQISNDWNTLYEITTLDDNDIKCLSNHIDRKIIKEYKKDKKKDLKINKYNEASKEFKSDDILSYYGDFYEFSDSLENNSIDAIITDPPYPEEFLPLWEQMFEVANRILKPSKYLVCYANHQNLDKIFRLKNDLIYYWIFKLDFTSKPIAKGRNLIATWKPVLVYQKPPFKKIKETLEDTVKEYTKFVYDDRILHDKNWGQSLGKYEYLVDKFSEPGDLIFEPFAGTGTTLVAAQRMKRKCMGCEIDEKKYKDIIEGRLVKNE